MSSAEDAKVEEPLETVEWVLWQHHLPRHVRNNQQWKKDTSTFLPVTRCQQENC
jgi:hypothetical protein